MRTLIRFFVKRNINYKVIYLSKDKELIDFVNTIELVILLILCYFNNNVSIISINLMNEFYDKDYDYISDLKGV